MIFSYFTYLCGYKLLADLWNETLYDLQNRFRFDVVPESWCECRQHSQSPQETYPWWKNRVCFEISPHRSMATWLNFLASVQEQAQLGWLFGTRLIFTSPEYLQWLEESFRRQKSATLQGPAQLSTRHAFGMYLFRDRRWKHTRYITSELHVLTCKLCLWLNLEWKKFWI